MKYFNFDKDVQPESENRQMHKRLLLDAISNRYHASINFPPNKNQAHIDAILHYESKGDERLALVECKTDSYYERGNIVIELLAHCPIDIFGRFIPQDRFSATYFPGSSSHKEVLELIRSRDWGRAYGLGLTGQLPKNHILSYVFVNKKEPVRHFLAATVMINGFVSQNYGRYALLLTRTKRGGSSWVTISNVMRLDILANNCPRSKVLEY